MKRRVGNALAGLCLVLPAYLAVLAVGHSLGLPFVQRWLVACEPIAEFVTLFVPTMTDTAAKMTALGYGPRVPLIRHALAIGWVSVLAVFLAAPVALFCVRAQLAQSHAAAVNSGKKVWLIYPAAPALLLLVVVILFGSFPVSGRRELVSSNVYLPVIGGLFVVLAVAYAVTVTTAIGLGTALMQRKQASG